MLNALHELIIYRAEKNVYRTEFNSVDFRDEHDSIYDIMKLLSTRYDCTLQTEDLWIMVPSNWGNGEKLRKFKSYVLILEERSCG